MQVYSALIFITLDTKLAIHLLYKYHHSTKLDTGQYHKSVLIEGAARVQVTMPVATNERYFQLSYV